MPDLSATFIQWLLDQSEHVAPELLREGSWPAMAMDRVVSTTLSSRESANLRAQLRAPAESQRRATILIPGIMGSLLGSIRGVSALLWLNPTLLLYGCLNLLDLDSNGEADASPDVHIVPFGIEKMTYLRLIETLALHSRLYEFPYDWRKSNISTAHLLHESIQRWTLADPTRRFTIVCHSMGGLVARTYMALYPGEAEKHIERVIMVGSPLHGAPMAALAFSARLHPYLLVANLHEGNDLVQFSRSLPSAYQLLPPPPSLFDACDPYPFDWDIYRAEEWPVAGLRQDYLDRARALHELIARSDPQVAMVNIAGCHKSTVGAVYRTDDSPDGFYPISNEIGAESGDEQVPLWSTIAAHVTTYYVEERHALLVSNDSVLASIVAMLEDEEPSLPTSLPAPQIYTSRPRLVPLAQQLADMRARIESGKLTRVDLDRLFFWR